MRNRSIGLVFLSVFVWGVITYFLFLDSPGGRPNKDVVSNQINELKTQVEQRILDNQMLLKRLIEQQQRRYEEELRAAARTTLKPELDNVDSNKINDVNILPTTTPKTEKELQREKLTALASKKTLADGSPIIVILVFSCNRITVQKCLDQLIKLRPSAEQFPIIVSQDCDHQATADIIKSYGEEVIHIQTAIIVEDDLDIAPDFFEYFLGTYPLLVADRSLWCVSAWNDNGKSGLVDEHAPHLLYRTDFFPGLGWMLTRDLWMELSPKWPKSYWDDWIRQPEQRKNRACIRPELSRTRTFGKVGVSNGQFYEKHLKFIKLNDQFVPFTKMNLTYLLKDNYDITFVNEVYKSAVVTYAELKSGKIVASGPVRIPYYTRQTYKNTAKMLGLMDDFRSGVPRTGYRGVVTLFYNNRRVHLAPNTNWNGYDITWS
ncbi:hypothetical protein PV327_009047 [Microctonus hyperodae]|uniref:Alpha-1,3-mannosyl-glycoprotein 2-beta-N-acetylglucosaminyltransferase n=1 Tax=Microctonus hyperodae TaxID=165561 RepID=A0AA39KVN0_MICHY|nr:hypothetical protein PV327_009047 [Microctonus hyperodae]